MKILLSSTLFFLILGPLIPLIEKMLVGYMESGVIYWGGLLIYPLALFFGGMVAGIVGGVYGLILSVILASNRIKKLISSLVMVSVLGGIIGGAVGTSAAVIYAYSEQIKTDKLYEKYPIITSRVNKFWLVMTGNITLIMLIIPSVICGALYPLVAARIIRKTLCDRGNIT